MALAARHRHCYYLMVMKYLAATSMLIAAALAASCGSNKPLVEGTGVFEMVKAPVDNVTVTTPIMAGEAAKLTVSGTFNDDCSALDRYLTEINGSVIDVTVYARHNIAGCATQAVPFSGDYYISGVPAGAYTVRINGNDRLTAQLAIIQGNGLPDAGTTQCQEERLDTTATSFPDMIMAGQDLAITLSVVTPDTCTSFSKIDVSVEATGILLAINGWVCEPDPAGQGCAKAAHTLDLAQTVSGLKVGSYGVFVNGTNVGVVTVKDASQCASSLAPVQSVTAPATIRAGGDPCDITVTGSKSGAFSLAPFVEARTSGAVELTLEMYTCGATDAPAAPFAATYRIASLEAGTWVVTVNDMASATVKVLPACVRQKAPVTSADIYSSLYDNGTGQVLTPGTPLDAVVGGTFADGCTTFDGFDYALDGFAITLNAMALRCDGTCADKAQEFRETYTIYGLTPGHYTITINDLKTFTFDVVQ